MAFLHGKSTGIFFDEFDLSSYFRGSEIAKSVDTHETTTYGDSAKEYIVGLKDGSLTLDGLWDGGSNAVDEEIQAMVGESSAGVVTRFPSGATFGNRCELLASRVTTYTVSAPVGDLVTVTVDIQADGGIDNGVCLSTLGANTSTGPGASVDNSASSANGGIGHLHVTAASGTSPTLTAKIQHSSDDSTYSDLITFTQLTAAGSERAAATGTVNRYTRLHLTIGGTGPSFTLTAGFARR